MKICDWPITERPRERLLTEGATGLTDGELLAVLLGSGNGGVSAMDAARRLIADFGSLREFFCADSKRCLKQLGIGPARYAALKAALELARRHYGQALKSSSALHATSEIRSLVHARLRDKPYEVFCVLYFDVHYHLIRFDELFRGSIDGSKIYVREVVREAIGCNAFAVMLAHNHPSGRPEPSHADQLVTRRLKEALALVDVKVLDHLVVGETRCVSFADRGLI
jgi:DNA repair protein RadC